MSIGNTLNNFGKYTTKAKIYTGNFISIILIINIIGLILFKLNNKNIRTVAKVLHPVCNEEINETCDRNKCNKKKNYQCEYDLLYTVDGKELKIKRSSLESRELMNNMGYEIEYDPKNPKNVNKPFPFVFLIVFLVIALLIIRLINTQHKVMSKSRTGRQINAVSTAINMIMSKFNRKRN